MAASTANLDYFNGRSSTRPRPGASGLREWRESPQARSPRTPTLSRSISHQLASPGSFRVEQEDIVVYELGARHFSAGFAGESKPRCIMPFNPAGDRRVGDYRRHVSPHGDRSRSTVPSESWGSDYALYTADLRGMDLGLMEDKLDRTLRTAMIDYLQLDARPRKAVLVLPSLLPTPLLEIVLKVLFGHFTQPPSIALLTQPVMCCVSAGLRHGLVVDIGWEETVIVAVSEYKEICQRRSTRAGKMLVRETARVLEDSVTTQGDERTAFHVCFSEAEDIMQRLAWCRRRQQLQQESEKQAVFDIKLSTAQGHVAVGQVAHAKLAEPAERALFASDENNIGNIDHDDHDFPLHCLLYRALLSLPVDVRALCVSRIIVTGGVSHIPGLKRRLLQEVETLIDARGWDPVWSYGSAKTAAKDRAKRITQEHSANKSHSPVDSSPSILLSPAKMPLQESIAHADRVHDDVKDPVAAKINLAVTKDKVEPVKGVARGVESLGAWAGASLAAALRVKGVHEIEREGFLKHGLRSSALDI